jgi:phytoene desaturase
MRVAVCGAGVGGLAVAVRLAHAGHEVTVLEQGAAPGGKLGRLRREGFSFDTGPSLLTMPWVLRELFAATGPPLEEELELARVEPVTRYRFADGTSVELSADLPRALEALEEWSPGAGDDWASFLGTCAAMWRASMPVLSGHPPWPPRRPPPGAPAPSPLDFARVRPWHTLATLARAHARDPRLRMVIERFATYAGADPRRAPAALALAGWVEHAYGAWHVRGGLYGIVEALTRRLEALGAHLRLENAVVAIERDGARVRGVRTAHGEQVPADVVVWNGDELVLERLLGRRARRTPRSVSGLALLLGLRGVTPGLAHHEIRFPADYAAEFDDVFHAHRLPRDPTMYVSASCVTHPEEAPTGSENWFVLVNAPAGTPEDGLDAYAETLVSRLGVGHRVVVSARRSPADLARETGAAGGAIYGAAPHGRLGTVARPGSAVRGVRGLLRVGGTVHPGGGIPLVLLGARTVAEQVGSAGGVLRGQASGSRPSQVPTAP